MSAEITYSAFESRYRNKQYIGAGGFGKVYKVFDHAKNHYVALKVSDVRPEWNKFTLQNEVELVNRLPFHRNIARYDACYRFNTGFTGIMDFAVLKFYEYGNLEQFLKKEELTFEDKTLIIRGILDGVNFLHKNDVIHRDLKAQNILLHREDGVWTPKITDFGLSRQTSGQNTITNSAIGLSYAYAAPEQIQNGKIYKNVDLWSTGVLIYRVIADELPFTGRSGGETKSTESQLEVSRKIVNLEIPDKLETIPSPFKEMIKRCLVIKPEERAQSADELLRILKDSNVAGAREEIVPSPIVKKEDPQEQTLLGSEENDGKTEIMPGRNPPPSSPPPSFAARVPAPEYGMPKANVTQVVKQKTSIVNQRQTAAAPIPVTRFEPKTGEPNRGFKWWWLLIPLLLIGIGGGGYWFINSTGGDELPLPDPIPLDKRFVSQDEAIEEGQKDTRTLSLILSEVLEKQSEHKDNYRLPYLEAKIYGYQGDIRSAAEALKRAAKVAITSRRKGDTEKMLEDMTADERKAFLRLRKLQNGKYWNPLTKALKKSR